MRLRGIQQVGPHAQTRRVLGNKELIAILGHNRVVGGCDRVVDHDELLSFGLDAEAHRDAEKAGSSAGLHHSPPVVSLFPARRTKVNSSGVRVGFDVADSVRIAEVPLLWPSVAIVDGPRPGSRKSVLATSLMEMISGRTLETDLLLGLRCLATSVLLGNAIAMLLEAVACLKDARLEHGAWLEAR